MVQLFVGDIAKAVVVMYDSDGRETDTYDKITGIAYETDVPDVVTIVDEDAQPKDAEIEAVGVGVTSCRCRFDGDPGDGVTEILLQTEKIEVVLPPPGHAASGEMKVVTLTQVPQP